MQLHRIDAKVPLEDQLGEFKLLQDEGKIGLIGLSEVDVDQLAEARKIVEIASVQNLYNVANRSSEAILDACEAAGIGFIPWFPLATGKLAAAGSPLSEIAERKSATRSQIALAWPLKRRTKNRPSDAVDDRARIVEAGAGELAVALDRIQLLPGADERDDIVRCTRRSSREGHAELLRQQRDLRFQRGAPSADSSEIGFEALLAVRP